MKLLLMHGRNSLNATMNGWGFDGPTLEGIKAIHFTYGTPTVYFHTLDQAKAAQKVTGWEFWDDSLESPALSIYLVLDMVGITPKDEPASFFGDWELQED